MAQLTFKCSNCGSEQFEQPSDPQDDSVITCAGCGAKGIYGEIRDQAMKQAKELFQGKLGNLFKGK